MKDKIKGSLKRFWKQNRLQLGIAVAVIAAPIILVWLVVNIFFLPNVQIPRKDSIQPVTTDSLQPTELSEVIELFGPWESPATVENEKRIALLQEDGGIRVSQIWSVEFLPLAKNGWVRMIPPEISRLSINEQKVTIMTNKGVYFEVEVRQPFILAQTPAMLYLVDEQGTVWGISAAAAMAKKTNT